jgi:two-component system chemotaxis response regulator CheY
MEQDLSNIQVLIVDDSAIVRKAVKKAVVQAGVDDSCVREAEHGGVAVERIDEMLPDIVFLDVNMPVMNGEEFMEFINDDGRVNEMAVVIVSTEMNAKRLFRLAELGARGRLHKPFPPEKIREVIIDMVAAA